MSVTKFLFFNKPTNTLHKHVCSKSINYRELVEYLKEIYPIDQDTQEFQQCLPSASLMYADSDETTFVPLLVNSKNETPFFDFVCTTNVLKISIHPVVCLSWYSNDNKRSLYNQIQQISKISEQSPKISPKKLIIYLFLDTDNIVPIHITNPEKISYLNFVSDLHKLYPSPNFNNNNNDLPSRFLISYIQDDATVVPLMIACVYDGFLLKIPKSNFRLTIDSFNICNHHVCLMWNQRDIKTKFAEIITPYIDSDKLDSNSDSDSDS